MKILFYGQIFSPTSFSNVIMHLTYYLRKLGHEVKVKPAENLKGEVPDLINKYASHLPDADEVLKDCIYKDEQNFDTSIYFLVDPSINDPDCKIKTKKHIFYTVWSHENYPVSWARGLNQFDEVWTPSNANAEAIKNTGICTKKVVVVPHGYEPSIFYPTKKDNKILKIGMCNSICNFKGADVAINAFMQAFEPEDAVELWLQSTQTARTDVDKHGLYYNEYIEILNKYPNKQLKTFYYQKDCSIKEMADFYRSCNLILSPHRGDGFGLVPLESLACNTPVIVSEYHGPLDYISNGYPFFVCGDMSWTNRASGRHHFPDGGGNFEVYKYFEPNVEHMRLLLLDAYKDWRLKAELDCKQYFRGLSWSTVANLINGLVK